MLESMITVASTLVFAAIATHPVRFDYTDPSAKKVQLAGDFTAWSSTIDMTQKGATWSKTLDLPDDARIEYKLVVDGKWVLDPGNRNQIGNGLGGANSVWVGPKYRFSVHDSPPKHPMRRLELTVENRKIVVFAPQNSTGLPTLTYGDGPNYETIGKIQNVVQNLIEARKIRPIVLVLIPPIDRMKEYGSGWKEYGNYIFNAVLPAVSTATGASIQANDTYMGGSSMGGLISLRLAEEFPDRLAGGVHCQSPSVQWTVLKINHDDVGSQASLGKIAPSTRIWLDWGDFEEALTKSNIALTKKLDEMHRAYGKRVTPEGHTWTAWRNRMEAGLTYLLKK